MGTLRWDNVDAMSWPCIDVDAMLYKHHKPAGTCPNIVNMYKMKKKPY